MRTSLGLYDYVSKQHQICVFKISGRHVDKPVCLIRLEVSGEIRVDWVDGPVGSLKI